MYILTVKTYFGTKRFAFGTEEAALERMRLWAKHPTFIQANVQTVRTRLVQKEKGRNE